MPNDTLYAYKALQMSYKSYLNQQEPLNKNPFNQSKLAKMEKPKKTEKNQKKTEKKPKKPVPNLKFAVAFGFFLGCNPPPPPHCHHLSKKFKSWFTPFIRLQFGTMSCAFLRSAQDCIFNYNDISEAALIFRRSCVF